MVHQSDGGPFPSCSKLFDQGLPYTFPTRIGILFVRVVHRLQMDSNVMSLIGWFQLVLVEQCRKLGENIL